jgi:hypothetical protein
MLSFEGPNYCRSQPLERRSGYRRRAERRGSWSDEKCTDDVKYSALVIVVLDTTALHGDIYARGNWMLTLLHAASDQEDLEVWIPTAVVEELVRQFPARLDELRRKLRGHRHDVRAFGWDLPDLPKDIETEAIAYRPSLLGNLRRKGVRIADHPASVHRAIDWVAQRRKPVKSDGRGAVDAAVWLTVLEAAETGSEVVLVSNNTTDFADPLDSKELHEILLADLDQLNVARDKVRLLPRVLDVNREIVEPSLAAVEEANHLLVEPELRGELEDGIVTALRWTPIPREQVATWVGTEIDDALLEDFLPEEIRLLRADPLALNNFYATLEVRGIARLQVLASKDNFQERVKEHLIEIDPDWNDALVRAEVDIPIWALVEARTDGNEVRVAIEEIVGDPATNRSSGPG